MDIPEEIFDDFNEHDCKCEDTACIKVTNQYADVSIPFEIKPNAKVGEIETTCCGQPVVIQEKGHDNTCKVIISQKIQIRIPIEYEVCTKVGHKTVKCNGDCCR